MSSPSSVSATSSRADAARRWRDVLDLAAGDAGVAGEAAARLTSEGDAAWEAAIATAADANVAGAWLTRADAAALFPPAVAARLRRTAVGRVVQSSATIAAGAEMAARLAGAGIASVAIKGAAVIAALGPRGAARTTTDFDLVVAERDADRARAALREAGFTELPIPFERHMREIARSREVHNAARPFRRGTLEIDLHWRFGPAPPPALEAERLVARGVEARAGTHAFRISDPVSGVLIAVHHALRLSFDPACCARDLCDLRFWWEAGALADRLDELLAAAGESGLATALWTLWDAALARDPGHPLRAGYDRLGAALSVRERREACALARFLARRLAGGAPAQLTLQLFAPRLYARSLFAAGKAPRGADARDDEGRPAARKPLLRRVADLPRRAWRVARDLSRLGDLAAYRAVARAKSRFH